MFGLRRSGNHVFINWLLSQIDGHVRFFNNVYPNDPELNPPDKEFGKSKLNKYIVLSFEDRNLDLVGPQKWIRYYSKSETINVVDFLVHRSAMNVFASRVKSNMTKPLFFSGMSIPELYWQYICYSESRKFWKKKFGTELIVVEFEKFISSESEKSLICDQTNLNYVPVKLNCVDVRYGGGSSFRPGDKQAPSLEQLNSRWKSAVKDPQFLSWVSELNAISNSNKIEGWEEQFNILVKEGFSIPEFHVARWKTTLKRYVVYFVLWLRNSNFITRVRQLFRHRPYHT